MRFRTRELEYFLFITFEGCTTYLKSIQRAIILYSECLGVIHWEEVAILA